MTAACSPRPASTCRSTALYETFNSPSGNHRKNGAFDESNACVGATDQSIAPAARNQKPSGSVTLARNTSSYLPISSPSPGIAVDGEPSGLRRTATRDPSSAPTNQIVARSQPPTFHTVTVNGGGFSGYSQEFVHNGSNRWVSRCLSPMHTIHYPAANTSWGVTYHLVPHFWTPHPNIKRRIRSASVMLAPRR